MEKTLIDWIGENGMTDEVKKEETKCFKCKKEVLNKHFVNVCDNCDFFLTSMNFV